MGSQVKKFRLDNGLLVLLKEIHSAPIISQWLWYRVGSRNELPGRTGISHWVEHMQFKGTPAYPAGVLDRAISRVGGFWNAMTSFDWTAYYETLPAGEIDLALRLEADRMQNSSFEADDVEAERSVILSERQGHENSPFFRLAEAVQKKAFGGHPYGHEVIGEPEDLRTIHREDLVEHYRTYYKPGNALLSMAGAFEIDSMQARIAEVYGAVPAGPPPPPTPAALPNPAMGEQRLNVEGPGETTFYQVLYRSPGAGHPDFFPLIVTSSLLTGPTSLSAFGDGLSNRTSRLYRTLVNEMEGAVSVTGGLQATIDPYGYSIGVVVRPGQTVEAVINTMDAAVAGLADTPPTEEVVSRALKQARALFAYGSERITNQAFWLGFSEMFAGYSWFEHYLDTLGAVTPADVQRAAREYLNPANRVLGIYRPVAAP